MARSPKLLYNLRRLRTVSTTPLLSHSLHLQNPTFLSPLNPLNHSDFRSKSLSPSDALSNYILFRFLSTHSSTDNSNNGGGDYTLEDRRTESESLNLGFDGAEQTFDKGISYSPVRAVISLLDGYHDLTSFPWWVVIATSTLALRMALLPILFFQLKKQQTISELLPKLPPPLPPPLSGRSFREQFLLFRKEKRAIGCPSYLWNFASFFVQVPCFILWMTSIRRMSLDHHSGFDSGGVLWFQNLTEFPHGVLGPVFPILIAGLHFINVQISFQTSKIRNLPGVIGLLSKYYKRYLDFMTIPILVIGFWVPHGSLVYWLTNSSLTVVQQLSLKHPYIRKKLGLRDKIIPGEHRISIESLSPKELLDLALQHLARGHQDRALPLLRVATEKDPELVKALIAMGQILCSRGLLVEASEYFERAISQAKAEDISELILASYGAGVSLISQGRKLEGIERLKRIACLEEPEDSNDKACYFQCMFMLGSTLFQEGQKAEAAKYLRTAAVYDPAVNAYMEKLELDKTQYKW